LPELNIKPAMKDMHTPQLKLLGVHSHTTLKGNPSPPDWLPATMRLALDTLSPKATLVTRTS